jgi:hypothetical protein
MWGRATVQIQSLRSREADMLKGWLFLVLSILMLLVICGIAAAGLFTRPSRWSDRQALAA